MLPPTPRLTQAESASPTEDVRISTFLTQQISGASETLQVLETGSASTIASAEERETARAEPPPAPANTPKRTPVRKSLSARISSVPKAISAYFSPKRSSQAVLQSNGASLQDVANTVEEEATSPTRVRTKGTSTPLGYYMPLVGLNECLNSPSQQICGAGAVDIFAVVARASKEPAQAKGGPRDYYTILRITESSLPLGENIRVEVFRPWKAKLPVAAKGDVILLRAFVVKSRKRQAYLLSTDASAWCVWRYSTPAKTHPKADQPVWARKASTYGVHEEMKGPPVELGEEERDHASGLREWWLTQRAVADNTSEEADAGGSMAVSQGALSARL